MEHIFRKVSGKLDMADKQDFDRAALEAALTELGRRAYGLEEIVSSLEVQAPDHGASSSRKP